MRLAERTTAVGEAPRPVVQSKPDHAPRHEAEHVHIRVAQLFGKGDRLVDDRQGRIPIAQPDEGDRVALERVPEHVVIVERAGEPNRLGEFAERPFGALDHRRPAQALVGSGDGARRIEGDGQGQALLDQGLAGDVVGVPGRNLTGRHEQPDATRLAGSFRGRLNELAEQATAVGQVSAGVPEGDQRGGHPDARLELVVGQAEGDRGAEVGQLAVPAGRGSRPDPDRSGHVPTPPPVARKCSAWRRPTASRLGRIARRAGRRRTPAASRASRAGSPRPAGSSAGDCDRSGPTASSSPSPRLRSGSITGWAVSRSAPPEKIANRRKKARSGSVRRS